MEGVKHSIDHGTPISRMTFYINRVLFYEVFCQYVMFYWNYGFCVSVRTKSCSYKKF